MLRKLLEKEINAAIIHSIVWQHFALESSSLIKSRFDSRMILTFWPNSVSKISALLSMSGKSRKFQVSSCWALGRHTRRSSQAFWCRAFVLAVLLLLLLLLLYIHYACVQETFLWRIEPLMDIQCLFYSGIIPVSQHFCCSSFYFILSLSLKSFGFLNVVHNMFDICRASQRYSHPHCPFPTILSKASCCVLYSRHSIR